MEIDYNLSKHEDNAFLESLMLRTDIKNYLIGDGMSLNQLSRLTRRPVRELENDLKHLEKSIKHQNESIETEPAYCRKCQFEFPKSKWNKPSKCPDCKSTWIQEPKISISE